MAPCQCCAVERQFDERIAQGDLRRYRKRGPETPTRQLIEALRAAPIPKGGSLLDVGGGIGAIHHELLDADLAHAIHVDISSAYLAAAESEAQRRGHGGQVTFRQGEFRVLGAELAKADVVTLDRVVCCDPDYASLLRLAASHARTVLAISYPRNRWMIRAVIALSNAWRRVRGMDFRVHVHEPAAMKDVVVTNGFTLRSSGGSWIWAVEVFERAR